MIRQPDIKMEISKAWRLGTAPFRRLPSFLLPGAPKCGTSTLYDTLCRHPRVERGYRKEPTNFIHYPGSRLRCQMNYPFSLIGNKICGDASVEYFVHPQAAEWAHAIVPNAKLIFLLRDPVKRAWSDYQMFIRSGAETLPFREIAMRSIDWLSQPHLNPLVESAARNAFSPVRYLLNGMYEPQLVRWTSFFPKEQCLFLISEEFFKDFDATLARTVAFLSLPAYKFPGEQKIARWGGYSEKADEDTIRSLRQFFKNDNERLAKFLGRSLPWPEA